MFKGEPSARGAGRKRGAWFLRRPPKHQSVGLLCCSGERRERATGQRLKKRAGAFSQATCNWLVGGRWLAASARAEARAHMQTSISDGASNHPCAANPTTHARAHRMPLLVVEQASHPLMAAKKCNPVVPYPSEPHRLSSLSACGSHPSCAVCYSAPASSAPVLQCPSAPASQRMVSTLPPQRLQSCTTRCSPRRVS